MSPTSLLIPSPIFHPSPLPPSSSSPTQYLLTLLPFPLLLLPLPSLTPLTPPLSLLLPLPSHSSPTPPPHSSSTLPSHTPLLPSPLTPLLPLPSLPSLPSPTPPLSHPTQRTVQSSMSSEVTCCLNSPSTALVLLITTGDPRYSWIFCSSGDSVRDEDGLKLALRLTLVPPCCTAAAAGSSREAALGF